MQPLRIFVGYDPVETVAFHVLAHSILTRASGPVSIIPLAKAHLRSVYLRERAPGESTDFSLTRFLVPYLCGFKGFAVFMDCDMLLRTDILELVGRASFINAVHVVQHDYTPKAATKFLGHVQAAYPRKNWSSLMTFNNERCWALTPELVNNASPADLHRFAWLPEGAIGTLPLEWNHLVGETNQCPIEDAKVLHWTNGGPWMRGYEDEPGASEWFTERNRMLEPCGCVPNVVLA